MMKNTKSLYQLGLVFLSTALLLNAQSPGEATSESPDRPKVEVAFVLDTTGSMSGLIEGAKQKIWSIANEIASADSRPEVKFALIGYRDLKDDYVTKTYDLSDDLDEIYAKLMAFQAAGGGDAPESVNQALYESVHYLSWSKAPDTLRIIFLVGDAPPHMDYPDDVKFPETCQTAQDQDIIINTIQCGKMSETREIWQAIARQSSGEYVAIEQSGGMEAVSTPMDDDISRLNREMAETVVTYGDERAHKVGQEKVANAVASKPEAAAARYDYFSSSNLDNDEAPTAISGEEDLIAKLQQKELKASEIETEQLPDSLKEMEGAELQAHLARKSEQRLAIQKELTVLLEKRQQYLETKKSSAADGDGFDSKVNAIIRTQAASKGIEYGE